ncbi:hypothetical protein [Robertmurraya kyonggiensis]|nr:hypothetical protein [Robertmurraya kyonggiensis]
MDPKSHHPVNMSKSTLRERLNNKNISDFSSGTLRRIAFSNHSRSRQD